MPGLEKGGRSRWPRFRYSDLKEAARCCGGCGAMSIESTFLCNRQNTKELSISSKTEPRRLDGAWPCNIARVASAARAAWFKSPFRNRRRSTQAAFSPQYIQPKSHATAVRFDGSAVGARLTGDGGRPRNCGMLRPAAESLARASSSRVFFEGEDFDMRRINRREFTKLAGGAALAVPLTSGLAWPQEPPKKSDAPPLQQPEATRSGQAPLKLSKEQEEAVKKVVERRERQLGALRSRTLAYDLDPAFVFQVRQRPRSGRRTAGGGEP